MDLDFNNMIPELHYYIHRKCTPNWKIDPCFIPFIDITYVVAGKATYMIGNQEYTVRKGDLICIPKNTYRAATNIPADLMECYSTNIFLFDRTGQDVPFPIPTISHIGIIPQLISRFHEIHEEWMQKDFGYLIKVRGLLCMVLYQISNLLLNEAPLSREDPRIKKSIHYLSMHYAEPLTLEHMADLFHLHPVYYGNLFRNAMGTTFKQYLISLWLNYAENMLKSGEYSVGEVALHYGFSDIFYFSKLFKEKKGISPSGFFPTKCNLQTTNFK